MSSNEHPEAGLPKDHETGAVTSPQESHSQQIESNSSPVPENTITDHESTAISSDHPQSGDAPASHPATTGGESAPVEATTANEPESAGAIAQPASTDVPSTESEELKPGAELSSEQEDAEGKEVDAGPSLHITLLLTTGSRHPFTIDGQYLRKRSVNVENYDPFAMSVYTLKELIWREWRSGESSILSKDLEFCQGYPELELIAHRDCRLGNASFVSKLHSFDFLWKIIGRQVASLWYVQSLRLH